MDKLSPRSQMNYRQMYSEVKKDMDVARIQAQLGGDIPTFKRDGNYQKRELVPIPSFDL